MKQSPFELQRTLTRDAVSLNTVLGLPPLTYPDICHKYANGCECDACAARAGRPNAPRVVPIRQPWGESLAA